MGGAIELRRGSGAVSVQKKVLAIGTCRVQQPIPFMPEGSPVAFEWPGHRVHTINQAILLARYMNGANCIADNMLHTLSTEAFRQALRDPTFPHRLKARRKHFFELVENYDGFLVEISSAKEFVLQRKGERRFLNTFIKRDLERHAARIGRRARTGDLADIEPESIRSFVPTSDVIVESMQALKAFLRGKPIIWASHANVVEQPERYGAVHKTRAAIAQTVQQGAASLGDVFYDPTDLVRQHGHAAIFAKDGTDLVHFSDFALQRLAEIYGSLAAKMLDTPGSGRTI